MEADDPDPVPGVGAVLRPHRDTIHPRRELRFAHLSATGGEGEVRCDGRDATDHAGDAEGEVQRVERGHEGCEPGLHRRAPGWLRISGQSLLRAAG